MAGPAPLYGTCTILVPIVLLNSAPERWPTAPLPELEKNMSPGRFLASATSSFTFFTGSEGCVSSAAGMSTMRPSGVKSLTASKGRFLRSEGLMRKLAAAISVM